ncbi:MAG: acetoin utilization protein AcuC, partial [Chloroflexota bacterium]
MSRRSAFIYHDVLSRHVLREDHVMVPTRLRYTYELLESYGAFQHPRAALVEPRQATEEELMTFHTPEYVSAVQSLSRGER